MLPEPCLHLQAVIMITTQTIQQQQFPQERVSGLPLSHFTSSAVSSFLAWHKPHGPPSSHLLLPSDSLQQVQHPSVKTHPTSVWYTSGLSWLKSWNSIAYFLFVAGLLSEVNSELRPFFFFKSSHSVACLALCWAISFKYHARLVHVSEGRLCQKIKSDIWV